VWCTGTGVPPGWRGWGEKGEGRTWSASRKVPQLGAHVVRLGLERVDRDHLRALKVGLGLSEGEGGPSVCQKGVVRVVEGKGEG